MLQNIYKILDIPEADQKELNEALKEIINNNLFADLINSLSEEQKMDLKSHIEIAEDKIEAIKGWLGEHKLEVGAEQKAMKSVEDSMTEFINSLIASASADKKQQALDYLKGLKYA